MRLLAFLLWPTAASTVLETGRQDKLTGSRRHDQTRSLPEYELKAGFLFQFAKYVLWPEGSFDNAQAPISIGIVGRDPFGGCLDKALTRKTAGGRPFTIHRFATPEDIRRCHILFVPRTERAHMAAILERVGTSPVLTVGEDAGFSRDGGTINILIENETARLEVNTVVAQKANLTIDTKLLKAATIVGTPK